MKIIPIPFQEIAKHLKMDAGTVIADSILNLSLEQILAKRQDALDSLTCLPNNILDRMISFLDGNSALQLKITCAVFRVLVRENHRQETWYTLRFFDLASAQFAKDLKKSKFADRVLQSTIREVALRGDLRGALKRAEKLKFVKRPHNSIHSFLATGQALRGDLNEAKLTLQQIDDPDSLIESYEILAKKLTKRGRHVDALEITHLIPETEERTALKRYREILRSQLIGGDATAVFETVAKIELVRTAHFMPKVLIQLAREQAMLGNRVGAQRTVELLKNQDDIVKAANLVQRMDAEKTQHEVQLRNPSTVNNLYFRNDLYKELALNQIKKGDLDQALSFIRSIQNAEMSATTYVKIVKAMIRRGDLQAATTLTEECIHWGREEYAYAMIAVEKAKRGDFQGALEILCRMHDICIRPNAYQKIVTALLGMVASPTNV